MKKILVTGGAGFLGSHLCERLLDGGNEVSCIDDLSTGSRDNIVHLLNQPGFTFLHRDISADAIPLTPVDEIYNLACPASPKQYQAAPVQTIKTSVLGANAVLAVALRTGAKILQASTSEVYGDPGEHPQRETYWGNVNPIGERACYDEGKRCAEALFFSYHRQHGVDIRVARIFNTYGPRLHSDDGRVVSNFIAQALRGEDLTVYGGGSQTRSFCYVDDTVSGLIALMRSSIIGPVNLGNPVETTVRELALRIVSLTGSRSKVVYRALPADDPVRRCPDITTATTALGWRPGVDLTAGLERTVGYFRERLGG